MYLLNKKITNTNFLYAVSNVILNYELKQESLKRKDYVIKTLLKFVDEIVYNNYKWIEYDIFRKAQFKIITESNKNIDSHAVEDLIESLNNVNIKKKRKNSINENNIIFDSDNEGELISDKEHEGSSSKIQILRE